MLTLFHNFILFLIFSVNQSLAMLNENLLETLPEEIQEEIYLNIVNVNDDLQNTYIDILILGRSNKKFNNRLNSDNLTKKFILSIKEKFKISQMMSAALLLTPAALTQLRDIYSNSPDEIHKFLINKSSENIEESILTYKVMKALAKIKIDFNFLDKLEETLLIRAVRANKLKMVEFLIDNAESLDVNYRMPSGKFTALMYACNKGNLEIVKLLLKHKAIDITCVAEDGKTAIDYAKSNQHSCVVELLESRKETNEKAVT